MFIILLKFSANKHLAAEFMEDHKEWIQQGMDDGVFVLVGSLKSGAGGAILALNSSYEVLQGRIHQDPFVAENIVVAEVIELAPNQLDQRLQFLLE